LPSNLHAACLPVGRAGREKIEIVLSAEVMLLKIDNSLNREYSKKVGFNL